MLKFLLPSLLFINLYSTETFVTYTNETKLEKKQEEKNNIKIISGFYNEGSFSNHDNNKNGKYVILEQEWLSKKEQFIVTFKFIKDDDNYSENPIKFTNVKKLEGFYDGYKLILKYDGKSQKSIELNEAYLNKIRELNKDIDVQSKKLYLEQDVILNGLNLRLHLY